MNDSNIIDDKTKYIIDVSEEDFIEKVIEASEKQLVVVDFWAPWCGPCKQLGPMIENVVKKFDGRVVLAKVNIDENQQIATQLRVQSIPTVMSFKNKKIANAFQGAIPEGKIIEFIEQSLGEKLAKDNAEFFKNISELFNKKQFEEALNELEAFIGENSKDVKAIKLYLSCLASLSRFDEAKNFVSSLSDEIINDPEIKSAITDIENKENDKKGPSLEEIEKKFNDNPNNIDFLIELSDKYFNNNFTEKSFDLLLKNYSNNNDKNKEKIKKTMLKNFSILGNENEITKIYRKKFSSVMFA